jgi:prepilin-type N-terminal cleavage/methylation domain-containing protein
MNKTRGFTLVEIIIFIVIIGIITSALASAFQVTLGNQSSVSYQNKAVEISQQRMDIIMENKVSNGFSSFSDPCTGGSPPAVCSTDNNYTVASAITTGFNGDNNLKVITITVSGQANVVLTGMVGNYS